VCTNLFEVLFSFSHCALIISYISYSQDLECDSNGLRSHTLFLVILSCLIRDLFWLVLSDITCPVSLFFPLCQALYEFLFVVRSLTRTTQRHLKFTHSLPSPLVLEDVLSPNLQEMHLQMLAVARRCHCS